MKAVLLLLGLTVPAAALWLGPRHKSRMPPTPVILDGALTEWDLASLDDNNGIRYGFADDGKTLWVVLDPHTHYDKMQFSGALDQTLTIWLDPAGGKKKTRGWSLQTPQTSTATVTMDPVGVDSSTTGPRALASLGAPDHRGVLELAIPLAGLPETFSFGFEASRPLKWPQRPGPPSNVEGRRRDDRGPNPDEEFSPSLLWTRVTLSTSK